MRKKIRDRKVFFPFIEESRDGDSQNTWEKIMIYCRSEISRYNAIIFLFSRPRIQARDANVDHDNLIKHPALN